MLKKEIIILLIVVFSFSYLQNTKTNSGNVINITKSKAENNTCFDLDPEIVIKLIEEINTN